MFIFIFLFQCILITNQIRIIDKGILPLDRNSVGLQFFLDIENENSSDTCLLHSWPKMCCLFNTEDVDCDIMKIYGNNYDSLWPKERTTMLFVYPTVIPYDISGYCTFLLDYQCGERCRRKKELIAIHFDTKIKNKRNCLVKNYVNGQKIESCDSIDQDSLNECLPVNCDLKYSGHRPFYEIASNKCVRVPACLTDLRRELPDVIYEPTTNNCKDLDKSFSLADIYGLSAGVNVVTKKPDTKELKVVMESNCSTISQNLYFLRDMFYGKLNFIKGVKCDFSKTCNAAILSILICIFSLTVLFLLFVCCVGSTTWFHKKWSHGELHNELEKVKRKIRILDDDKKSTDKEVKNMLLREVIVSDIPLELQDDVYLDDYIDREIDWKKRYRSEDIRGQFVWKIETDDTDTSTTSEPQHDENDSLLK